MKIRGVGGAGRKGECKKGKKGRKEHSGRREGKQKGTGEWLGRGWGLEGRMNTLERYGAAKGDDNGEEGKKRRAKGEGGRARTRVRKGKREKR